MFQSFRSYPADPIFSLVPKFQLDPRPDKVNLSIGMYYDEAGQLPLLRKLDHRLSMENIQLIEQVYGTPHKPWRRPDGSAIACTEKIKTMRENLEELRQVAQDLIEDAVLMGCDESQVKEALAHLVGSLSSGYRPICD